MGNFFGWVLGMGFLLTIIISAIALIVHIIKNIEEILEWSIALLPIAMILGAIYGLVKFVKWAWEH